MLNFNSQIEEIQKKFVMDFKMQKEKQILEWFDKKEHFSQFKDITMED